MQKCSICEKPIYGHPQLKSGQKLVCGSCPLTKSQGGPSGKSLFEVRLDLAKTVTKKIPDKQESVMRDLKVKSNVQNRTILLDGKHPLVFDEKGEGKLPAHLRELLDREMRMRPGRYSIVEDTPIPVMVVEEVTQVPVETPVTQEPEVKKESAPVEEIPPGVDQSFLTEKTPKPASKKASKKIVKE